MCWFPPPIEMGPIFMLRVLTQESSKKEKNIEIQRWKLKHGKKAKGKVEDVQWRDFEAVGGWAANVSMKIINVIMIR